MEINLGTVEFSSDEVLAFLKLKGFKVEVHIIRADGMFCSGIYAIPHSEEFVEGKHKRIDDVLKDEIKERVNKFVKEVRNV